MSTPPRHSACVILVRPAPAAPDGTDYEVYMVRRAAESVVAPGAYVFPGGTLRADDYPPAGALHVGLDPAAAHARLGGAAGAGLATPRESLALWIAALRELFEEAGILLARDGRGRLLRFGAEQAARFAAYRLALQNGELSLWELAAQEGLILAPECLRYWAHWITPEGIAHRFNTRFFLALLPPGQEALPGAGGHTPAGSRAWETTDGVWIAPHTALARHAAQEFPLVFATQAHLERLARFRTLAALWAHAATKPVVTVLPRLQRDTTPPRVVIPEEVRECW
jgi:8-oxo-dGTP pyrophosphatase MutT (NUDIX family)